MNRLILLFASIGAAVWAGRQPGAVRWAADHNQPLALRAALVLGAPANVSWYGLKPIHRAAVKCAGCIAPLVAAGADVDIADFRDGGWTPLHHAVNAGHLGAATALLDYGAAVGRRVGPTGEIAPLDRAIRANDPAMARLLLDYGAELDAPTGVMTPLHVAAMYGRAGLITELARRGADVDARDEGLRRTPLFLAASRGHAAAVEALLAAGADPRLSAGDPDSLALGEGLSPAAAAARAGHTELARRLTEL